MTFIVLDGPDATGTSTHAMLLAERLQKGGHDVLLISEPTDGPVGKKIKEYLKSGEATGGRDRRGMADPMALQMMFTRDREWHVKNEIEPALNAGKIVVCDRYWYSTIAYAAAQNLPIDELKELNSKFIQPDCVIFTLPPLEVALKRMMTRASNDIFEHEHLQQLIHRAYRSLAEEDPLIRVIDTSGSKEHAAEEILRYANARMHLRSS